MSCIPQKNQFSKGLLSILLMTQRRQDDSDLQEIQSDPSQFESHYEHGYNCFTLRVLLLHTLAYLYSVKQHIKHNEQLQSKPPLSISQLKNIQPEDGSITIAQQLLIYLKEWEDSHPNEKIGYKTIFIILIRQLSGIITYSITLYFLEMVFKLGFSILLNFLFKAVMKGNTSEAYIYAGISSAIWFLGQIFRHNAYYSIPIISCRIRAGLILLMYAKISRLTSFAIKSAEIGKIINLLSNDFNSIQTKLPFMLAGLMFPFGMIGGTIIIWFRLGWGASFAFIVPIIVFPIALLITKKMKDFLIRINISKDSRVKLCSQIIEGIKFIKLYGWQMAFKKKIQVLRQSQISNFMYLAIGRSFQKAISNSVAYISGFFMFLIADRNNQLGIQQIFSSLEILTYLRFQLFYFISGLGLYFEFQVTFERFANIIGQQQIKMIEWSDEYIKKINQNKLNQQQLKGNVQTQHFLKKSQILLTENKSTLRIGQIQMINFNGYWSREPKQPCLKNINLHFLPNGIYGVAGKVGSGKSGILLAILGQLPYYSGKILTQGAIAYVQQEPIILSGTIRQNIIFLRPLNENLYDKVIQMASLHFDFREMTEGDLTLIGQKGITLSGGQKARVALARALYADADIYLLDDPLSAVDAKVAHQLYNKCILPLSKAKTVVLVTHQTHFLSDCRQIIIMEEGRIFKNGTPQYFLKEMRQLGKQYLQFQSELPNQKQFMRQIVEEQRTQQLFKPIIPSNESRDKQIQTEVTFWTYVNYLFNTDINKILFPITIIIFLGSEAVNMVYLRQLANYSTSQSTSYWMMLGFLQLGYFIGMWIRYFLLNIVILFSNEKLHELMIEGLVRSPTKFFDVNPSGRLINTFSNDLGLLDMTLPFSFTDMIEGPIVSIAMLINVFTIQIYFIPPGIANIIFLIVFFAYSKKPIVQCRQLYLKLRTPVFNLFGQMITALTQINVFGTRKIRLKEFAMAANLSTKTNISFNIVSRGFGAYVSYVSSLILVIGFFIGVYFTTAAQAGSYGVTIILLTGVSDYLQYFLKQIITVQSIMVSSQRAMSISKLEPQSLLRTEQDQEIAQFKEEINAERQNKIYQSIWPVVAELALSNFSLKYREELPLVLKNINFNIKSGERVGIIGRTGAGKSSIIHAIFRLTQPVQGSKYSISSYDALKLGLHSLRKHISVIPQTPFLFKGTIRENLDPFSVSTDEQLWKVLEDSNLSQFVKSQPDSLQTDLSKGTQVFSVGQKQLLCLARALLRKNKILVLDEATSNVDLVTDEYIQRIIRQKFFETTIITIAHRLNTISDYDKIIVMSEGNIIEIGTPWQLLQDKGFFHEMVMQTGDNAPRIKEKAYQKYLQKLKQL